MKLTFSVNRMLEKLLYHYHHQYHVTIMDLGPLLNIPGLTHPEVSSMVFHGSLCLLDFKFFTILTDLLTRNSVDINETKCYYVTTLLLQ
jgi:hypothetical protein